MNLTRKQLKKALQGHPYILARLSSNHSLIGINTKVANLKHTLRFPIDDTKTVFCSYMPCSFIEYISYKAPFIG